MRSTILAAALLMSSAAIAQTATETDLGVEADTTVTSDTGMTGDTGMSTDTGVTTGSDMSSTTTAQTGTMDPGMPSGTPMAATMTPASGPTVAASNANPERDARGIAVVSADATVPAGWNGITGSAVGGPLVDPSTGQTTASDSYPACSSTVTDNCLQTYERGRS